MKISKFFDLLGEGGCLKTVACMAKQALANEMIWRKDHYWDAIISRLDGANGHTELTAVQSVVLPGTGSQHRVCSYITLIRDPPRSDPTIITDPMTRDQVPALVCASECRPYDEYLRQSHGFFNDYIRIRSFVR